jgi:cell division protease FtsH
MEHYRQQLAMWYFVILIALLLLGLLQHVFTAPDLQPLDYSEFKALLRAGHIVRVTLSAALLQGAMRAEGIERILPQDTGARHVKTTRKEDTSGLHPFTAVRVDDPNLVQELEAAKVPYRGTIEHSWVATLFSWVLPAVMLIGVWSLLLRRLGPQRGLMSIGKSKAKVYMEKARESPFRMSPALTKPRQNCKKWCSF